MIRRLLLLILSVVMGSMTMNAQHTLDLTGEKPFLIKGKGTVKIDNSKDKENKYIIYSKDSITINKIVFAKEGKNPETLVVTNGNDTIINNKEKKSFITTNITISKKHTLTIKWGDKTWTFNMHDKTQQNTSTTDTKDHGKTKATKDSSKVIVGLFMFVFGFLIGRNRLRLSRFFKRNNTESSNSAGDNQDTLKEGTSKECASQDKSTGDNSIVSDGQSEGTTEDLVEEDITDKDELKKALDEQIAIIIKGYEDEFFQGYNDNNSKVERLQEILSKYFNLLDDQNNISKALSIKEDSDTERILSEIKTIKSELSKYKSKEGSKNDDNKYISVSELERLIQVNKISKEFYNTKGDFNANFKQLLEKLCRKVENSIDTKSTDDLLKAHKYVIGVLMSNGFEEYFDSNTTLLKSGLEKIKEDLKGKKNQSSETKNNTTINGNTDPKLSCVIGNLVKKLHRKLPNISDSISNLDDLVKAIQELIKTESNAAEKGDISPSENAGEMAIDEFLKNIGIQHTETQEDAKNQIVKAIAKSKELDDICKQYKADNGKELFNAIKEHIYKSIKGQLEAKTETKDIIANCHTTEGIVEELSDAYSTVDSDKQNLEKEREVFASNLKEAHVNEGIVEQFDDSDLNAMFNAYKNAVCQKVNTANERIITLEKEKEEQKDIIEANNETFNKMRSKMLDVLDKDISDIQKSTVGTFIRPCDINLKSQCDDNQSLLRNAFEKFEKRLQDTKTISSHEELYKEVQKIIEEDIVNEYGLTNVLTRYYTYSCLPFMTDQAREYGMRIDHESMMLAYNALVHLTNGFGLQLIVPNLFADRITDGEYKDCTGEKYGDLENMCPGVANYVREIENSDKQHYITDLVRVGYKKNYEVKQKAMVIVAQ